MILPIGFNKTFEEVSSEAYNNQKSFCVVLIDSVQMSQQNYIKSLNSNYSYLRSKVIYNIIDVNRQENTWYAKWLNSPRLPLTCVFSSNATLIDIIPGGGREAFLYTEKAINTNVLTEFHWPNKFGVNKKTIIPFLNNVLKNQKYLDQGIFIPSEFDQMPDSLNYPYSLYLRLSGELMHKDSLSSRKTAQSLLTLETPLMLNSYKDEFIMAKKIIFPDFSFDTEPTIRVDSSVIFLNDCVVEEKVSLNIPVYNDGEYPLNISKIYLSCSCVKHAAENENVVIPAESSHIMQFVFTPENEGDISRDIYIASNAINMPILHINILAKAINLKNLK
jgi:hypothetical protein